MFKDHQWIATIGRTSPAAFASRKTYGSQNRRLSSSGQFSGDNFCRQAGTAFGDGIDNVPLKFNDLLLVRARISQNSERNPRLRLRPRGPCANSTVDVRSRRIQREPLERENAKVAALILSARQCQDRHELEFDDLICGCGSPVYLKPAFGGTFWTPTSARVN
jgi:hypothetical protein